MPLLILLFVVLRWAFGIACALLFGVVVTAWHVFAHPESFLLVVMVVWSFWSAWQFLRSLSRVLRGH